MMGVMSCSAFSNQNELFIFIIKSPWWMLVFVLKYSEILQ